MSSFNGEFVVYSSSDMSTPIFTCSMSATTPLTALATLISGSFVIVLRSTYIQKTLFTLTIITEGGSESFNFPMLPAAFAVYLSEYGVYTDPSIVPLVKWNAETSGSFSITHPYYYDPVLSATSSITVWTPILLNEGDIYSLTSTGGDFTFLLEDNVYQWDEDIALRFFISSDRELVIYPCPAGYSAAELLYTASNVGGGIFTFGPTGEGPQQFTPRLTKKTYYGGCFADGSYTLTYEHSAGNEEVDMFNMGALYGSYDNSYFYHTAEPYISHSYVSNMWCNDDEVEAWFESSFHCLVDEYGADNEFALTASPVPFRMCLKNDTLFRVRALSFDGGHLHVSMNGVTADYDLTNFGEGWLRTGTGVVSPPEGYEGYYEVTPATSEQPIPANVQTLFVNRLNNTEYREFDLSTLPNLEFFVVLGNTAIGVKAESHANLRLVNITMDDYVLNDTSVFNITDCPQLAAIHLHYVSAASFAVNCSPLLLASLVALPSLTYFGAYESIHTAATLEVKGG